MGQPNDVLNYYLQRNDRIAAICNYCVGEALFTPENIKPMDGIYSVRNVKNKITHIQRDILRQAEVNGKRLLIGIENQNNINLIFPFRQMEMDCLEIRRQIEELQEKNKGEPGTDDFMYGINETDKLMPVMDIVLYWGKAAWKHPKTLMDMLDMENVPKELKPLLNDYHINLVSVREIPDEELDKMQSDIGQVIGIIKHSQSLPELKECIEKHREGFMHFSRSAADVIDVCVGIRALKEVMQYHKNEEKEEECNMCQAIDDLVRISTDEGITIGMEKGMEKGIEKGIAKGKSEAVVQLLEQHGAIPQETINRIVSEKNPEHLKRWLFLAASVKTVEEFCAVM